MNAYIIMNVTYVASYNSFYNAFVYFLFFYSGTMTHTESIFRNIVALMMMMLMMQKRTKNLFQHTYGFPLQLLLFDHPFFYIIYYFIIIKLPDNLIDFSTLKAFHF